MINLPEFDEFDRLVENHYGPDGRPLNLQPIDPMKAQDEFENFLAKNRIFYPSDFGWRKYRIDDCMVMSFSKEATAKKAVATIEKNSLWKAKYIGSEFIMGIDPKTGEDSKKHGYTSYMVQVLNLELAYSAANLGVKEKIKEYKFKRDLESNNWYGIEILARQHNDTELADAAEAARTAVSEVQRLIDQKYYWK